MALEILSTIASARSISGKVRYICDWKEVGEVKSLRSENGLRVVSRLTFPDGTLGIFTLVEVLFKLILWRSSYATSVIDGRPPVGRHRVPAL
jgi:hypothetical protein